MGWGVLPGTWSSLVRHPWRASALSSNLSSRRVEQQEVVEGGWGAEDCKSCVVDLGPFGLCRGPREAYVLGCAKVVGHVGFGIRLPRFKSRPCFQP